MQTGQITEELTGRAKEMAQWATGRSDEGEHPSGSWRDVNVGQTERKISTIAGAGLVLAGLWRRSLGGLLLAGVGGSLVWRGVSGHCLTYELLGLDTARNDAASQRDYDRSSGQFVETVIINKSPQELYDAWRDLERHPRIFPHVKSVERIDDKRTHWVLKGPAGVTFEYDAETTQDEPGRLIAWRTSGHSDLDHTGSVRFEEARGNRGTQVRLEVRYIPPVGGKRIARLANRLGLDRESYVREGLRNFKRLMEAGEIPTTEGQPAGAGRA